MYESDNGYLGLTSCVLALLQHVHEANISLFPNIVIGRCSIFVVVSLQPD